MSRAALMARALHSCAPYKRGAPCKRQSRRLCVRFHPSGLGQQARPKRDKWRLWRGGAPLPIPNREVKPRRDDDTAGDRGKVVRRPPTTESPSAKAGGLVCFYALPCFPLSFGKGGNQSSRILQALSVHNRVPQQPCHPRAGQCVGMGSMAASSQDNRCEMRAR